MADTFKYAKINEAPIYDKPKTQRGAKVINKVLMGTYIALTGEEGDYYKVFAFKKEGYMLKSHLTDQMGLKVFFLDVGQGDGMLIEVGSYKILVDAGPSDNMHGYLTKFQYTYLLNAGKKVHIDYLIVSHFDMDHYRGFIKILSDKGFTFGTICHPGILKFAERSNPYNTALGEKVTKNGTSYITTIFDDLLNLSAGPAFNRDLTEFIEALQQAKTEGRVQKAMRYKAGDMLLSKTIEGKPLKLEVLAPFTEKVGSKNAFIWWENEAKTINGHSLVIKVTFGTRTLLLGGDLNSKSETYLLTKYNSVSNPFEVDVAKSCHHGSSDFTEAFMAKVNALATVISSGDNEGHAHPRADAVGCAGKYSRSVRPLVYSTELARSTNIKTGKILFGMINLRCNGTDIFMSQMKEVKRADDLWDAYEVK